MNYPFSSPENFEFIVDCEPLIGEPLSILTAGMGEDYVVSEYNGNSLITYDNINVGFITNEKNIIIGLLGKKGIRLSALSEIGMTFDELKQGLASLVWTDETIIIDEKELRVAIADIGGTDYRVYFYGGISLFAEL